MSLFKSNTSTVTTNTNDQTDDYTLSFDPDKYHGHNYAHEILPEDRHFIEFITRTSIIEQLGVTPKSFERIIDAGNASVFIGAGLMAPFLKDDGQIVLYDVGQPQIRKIDKTLRKGRRGYLGIWQKFEDLMAVNPLWTDAISRVCHLGVAEQKSVFDLEASEADAGCMFYVAESITSDHKKFEQAANTFLDAIKPGGLVIWAGMNQSEGYTTPGDTFSASWIEPQDMLDIADDKLKNIKITHTQASFGARPSDGPQYGGMTLLVGIKR